MADPHTNPEPDGAVQRRERGMHRVSNATRWTVAAAAAGSVALGLAYTHLLPGTPAAPAAGGQPATGAVCTQQPAAPAVAPASVARGERDDEGERTADDGERGTAEVQPAAAVCPGGTTAPGLTPPTQSPAPAQQAPQTRTGAS